MAQRSREAQVILTWLATTIGGVPAEVGYAVTRMPFDDSGDPPRCDIQRILIGANGAIGEIMQEVFAPEVLDELTEECAKHQIALGAEDAEWR